MKNKEIAALFERIADVLEIKGENIFRVNSYRKVARVLDEMTEDVAEVAKAGRLESIAGVGKGTAEKIVEYLDTGRMSKYEEVMKGFPPGLADMLDIPGMGPKTVALVWQKLGVVDLAGLEKAIADGKALGLPGMGEKKVANIQKGIALLRSRAGRLLLGVAFPLVQEILGRMRQAPGVRQIEAAGSLRRMKETIGDIDILVAAAEGKKIIEAFTKLPNVVEVLAAGDTKGSVRV
ncbi:MAG: DNA polymerase III, partial [Planctomycetes bacterium]|nr:DNA polymerase III [Planctomycetota bacterium]